jgi:hypothetical protein
MVEGLLSSMFGSIVQSSTKDMPPLTLAPDGEPITAGSILDQIEKNLDHEPKTAMRLALVLGAYLARQNGVSEKEALLAAGLAWGQTSGLTPR